VLLHAGESLAECQAKASASARALSKGDKAREVSLYNALVASRCRSGSSQPVTVSMPARPDVGSSNSRDGRRRVLWLARLSAQGMKW
jgi:hypothetical protein